MVGVLAVVTMGLLHVGTAGQTRAVTPVAPAFEVATVKQVDHDPKGGRFIKMDGVKRFVAKDYTVKLLIAAAYDVNPKAVLGGPGWVQSEHYDIAAVTPGETRPTRDEQMAMLRGLLTERFQLTFHREPKEFSIYVLDVARGGPKLKPSTAAVDTPAALISTVYPDRILLPARNTTMPEVVSLLQRAVLDRPGVDKTGIAGRYDFDLTWAPDETQFGGEVPVAPSDAPSAPLFKAIQEQLGLRLEATRGQIAAVAIDTVERPSAN